MEEQTRTGRQRPADSKEALTIQERKELTRSLVCYTVLEVASLLHVPYVAVISLIRKGMLKGFKTGSTDFGGSWRVPAWAISEYQLGRVDMLYVRPGRFTAEQRERARQGLRVAREKFRNKISRINMLNETTKNNSSTVNPQ